jgi:DNA-directed RNA polymerase subunit N (RpoN/RPB10)
LWAREKRTNQCSPNLSLIHVLYSFFGLRRAYGHFYVILVRFKSLRASWSCLNYPGYFLERAQADIASTVKHGAFRDRESYLLFVPARSPAKDDFLAVLAANNIRVIAAKAKRFAAWERTSSDLGIHRFTCARMAAVSVSAFTCGSLTSVSFAFLSLPVQTGKNSHCRHQKPTRL